MSFSFNWAGTNIQQINPQESRQAYEDAKNLGTAAAGADRMWANKKYKDLLNEYNNLGKGGSEELAALKAELAQLEARNAEIASMIRV